jgi:hypothetical protein
MSHKCVEAIIGKLATDEGFRRRFLEDAMRALEEALVDANGERADDLPVHPGQRLQKVDLTSNGKGD